MGTSRAVLAGGASAALHGECWGPGKRARFVSLVEVEIPLLRSDT